MNTTMLSHIEPVHADMKTLDPVAEPPYDTNFDSLRNLSDEREQALIERAREGSQAARDEIFCWLLPPVKRFASRYYLAHSWQVSAALCPDDLVAEASLRMLERFAAALSATSPLAYLLQVAYKAVCKALWQGASSIRTPYTPGVRPIPVKSLHAPLEAFSEDTLLDILPAADLMRCTPLDERDYTPIYQAAASLTETERAVLAEWYGLHEIAPLSLESIISQIGRTGMGSYKAHALAKLYRMLAPVYSQYRTEGYVQELRTPGIQVKLSESHELRLEAAYAQLQQSGQKVTVRLLAQMTGVSTAHTSMYLQQQTSYQPQMHVRPAEDRAVRVAEAYAQLQESGQEITRRTLGAAAHVNWHYAAAYIQQRGESPSPPPRFGGKRTPQEREARLAQAYAQLQHSERPITADALSKAAHVRRQTATTYLRQRQQASHGGDAV